MAACLSREKRQTQSATFDPTPKSVSKASRACRTVRVLHKWKRYTHYATFDSTPKSMARTSHACQLLRKITKKGWCPCQIQAKYAYTQKQMLHAYLPIPSKVCKHTYILIYLHTYMKYANIPRHQVKNVRTLHRKQEHRNKEHRIQEHESKSTETTQHRKQEHESKSIEITQRKNHIAQKSHSTTAQKLHSIETT